MATKKVKSKSSQYTLMKGALLDVSVYVHSGIEIEEIEDTIAKILIKNKQGIAKPVSGFLAYHIQTQYEDDKDIIKLMDKIVLELDLLLAKLKYDDVIKKIN